jgi:histidinol-phosphate/aromatic aminotransferase/cobyric acid decarboxylase-like protein
MNLEYDKFIKLKSESGLHSPSIFEIQKYFELDINVDACFLCNPYAFDLFMKYYRQTNLVDYIKYYPPQNKVLSNLLSKTLNINSDYLMIGNGAIQMIELILREFEGKRKCIISPTFSSYYEFDFDNILFYKTHKEDNFNVNTDQLISFCTHHDIELLVIVNPNNPTGNVISKKDIKHIVKSLKKTTIIVDESFIDFYDKKQSVEQDVYNNMNLIVIRSLSKDFGIAGLRLGYAVANPKFNKSIFSKYGLCWNINGIAHFFLELMSNTNFIAEYKTAREKYLDDRDIFYNKLLSLKNLKVYPSRANFFIIDCGINVYDIFAHLLFEKGIYTRLLNDKLDLDDTFLRIACNTNKDNDIVFSALKEIDEKIIL